MEEPEWVQLEAIEILHARSLALHGGPGGLRDRGLLESALQRPKNRFFYEDVSDLIDLAATYAAAISSNHPFADGNKRAAFQCMTLFLRLNGVRLEAARVEAAAMILALAAGELHEAGLANWLRSHVQPITSNPPAPSAA